MLQTCRLVTTYITHAPFRHKKPTTAVASDRRGHEVSSHVLKADHEPRDGIRKWLLGWGKCLGHLVSAG